MKKLSLNLLALHPPVGCRVFLLLFLALLGGFGSSRLLAQDPFIPAEWQDVVVANAGEWKLVSFVPNRPQSIYPVCQTTYQRPSGEQIRLDIYRPTPAGKAKENYNERVSDDRKHPRLWKVVTKPRKNSAGTVVGEFAVAYSVDLKAEFCELATWVDGESKCDAQVVIPPEMEKAKRDVQLKRYGGLVENFADGYRHP